jgi:TonB family protein
MRAFLCALGVACACVAGTVQAQEVYKPGNGVTLPIVTKDVRPQYTKEAMKARIVGTVMLDITVTTEGSVTDVEVVRSLDTKYGLDEQAVKAAKLWQFKPGTKDGKAVAVRVNVMMTFTLK